MKREIYAPIIGDVVPAFVYNETIKSGWVKIPFQHNPMVNNQTLTCYIYDFNDNLIGTATAEGVESSPANFNILNLDLLNGCYYKFKLSYGTNQENNAKSYIAVGLCIAQPNINFIVNPTGYVKVEMDKDQQEKIYSYKFILYNSLNTNNPIDKFESVVNYSSQNPYIIEFYPNIELIEQTSYVIKFSYNTINGYSSIIEETFTMPPLIPGDIQNNIKIVPNVTNGYIEISLTENLTGKFQIQRFSDNIWKTLYEFTVTEDQDGSDLVFRDFTIEHEKEYIYGIRQLAENGTPSKRVVSEPISLDFEDIFLTDETRQLRVRFDPKVSGFRKTILESKLETIGGKYPFFFRNGQVDYKEIPISGLISHLMDEDHLFIDKDFGSSIDQTGDNIAAEREFKLEVLDWLTNGKPKLFRSPTEGNYLIRLMNVSLSPNDTLGRMLHSFSATGYEIGAAADFKTFIGDSKQPKYIYSEETISNPTDSSQTLTKVRDITWTTNKPGLTAKITLDGQDYYNISGIYNSPIGKIYETVSINYPEDSINTVLYKQIGRAQQKVASSTNTKNYTFEEIIKEFEYSVRSFDYKTAIKLQVYHADFIVARKDMNSSYDSSILIIDNSEIDLSDEQSRTYYDIGENITITKPKGIHLDIGGYFKVVE